MSEPDPRASSPEPDLESLPAMTLDQWLEKLRRSDRAFYNIMAIEVWSIAKTMDSLVPGFWNRFMINRRSAVKQFVEQKRLQHPSSGASISPPNPPSKR